jgi:hypothetical protein
MKKHSSGDYDIDIEIDADSGTVTWRHRGIIYPYSVEELEGKGVIQNLLGHADITVYSQGERLTVEEYLLLTGGQ